MSDSGIFGLEFEKDIVVFEKLFSCLKSAPSNLPICKTSRKNINV